MCGRMYLSVDCAGVQRSPRLDKTTVCFGDTIQDILSSLGAPSKVFYKAEDKVNGPPTC